MALGFSFVLVALAAVGLVLGKSGTTKGVRKLVSTDARSGSTARLSRARRGFHKCYGCEADADSICALCPRYCCPEHSLNLQPSASWPNGAVGCLDCSVELYAWLAGASSVPLWDL